MRNIAGPASCFLVEEAGYSLLKKGGLIDFLFHEFLKRFKILRARQ